MQVLVISPHPDDESIGCGGSILQHMANADVVSTLFLTSGENGGHGRSREETAKLREEEARAAAAVLGTQQIDFWHLPDGAVEVTADLVERLKSLIAERNIDLIYVTHDQEMHPDHRAAAELVREATNGMSNASRPLIRMYEVWTPLQEMDDILDITAHMDTKRTAIRLHKSQCDVLRFDEAVAGLNRYRGEMHSWPGGDYAEVFKRMYR